MFLKLKKILLSNNNLHHYYLNFYSFCCYYYNENYVEKEGFSYFARYDFFNILISSHLVSYTVTVLFPDPLFSVLTTTFGSISSITPN